MSKHMCLGINLQKNVVRKQNNVSYGTNFHYFSNHSLQLALQRTRQVATTRLISYCLDELCKPGVKGKAVQVLNLSSRVCTR